MSFSSEPVFSGRTESPLASLRRNWAWFLVLGIILVVLGTLAISASFIATLATVVTFGVLLLLASGAQIASAVWARNWGGFFLHLFAGIFYFLAGLVMIEQPLQAAVVLTLLVAAFLIVGGLLRIIVSLTDRFHGWGWVLLSGVISFGLGVFIWRSWPWSSVDVIGIFVGVDLLFVGWSWVMLALALKPPPSPATSPAQPAAPPAAVPPPPQP